MVLVASPVAVETVQLAVEAAGSEGVKVPATRVLQSLGITLDPEVDMAVFGPAGQLYDTAAVLNREWSTGGLSGQPDYREVAFVMSGVFGDAVITEVATGVYDWVWTPRSVGGLDRPRTYSVERGVLGLWADATSFATFTAFNQNFSREGGNDQGGSLFARRLEWDAALSTNEQQTVTITGGPTGGNFTLGGGPLGGSTANIAHNATAAAVQAALEATPGINPGDVYCTGGPFPATPVVVDFRGRYAQQNVAIMTQTAALTGGAGPAVGITTTQTAAVPVASDVTPVMPGEINVYVDNLHTAIGTTQYTGDFGAGWGIGDRRNPVWTLNRNLKSFASTVETKPNPTATLTLNNDDTGRQLVDYMRRGASKYVRIECVSGDPIPAAPAYRYEWVVDLHGKLSGAPGRGDQAGARTLEWPFRVMHSSAWGKAWSFRLRTDMASLAAA